MEVWDDPGVTGLAGKGFFSTVVQKDLGLLTSCQNVAEQLNTFSKNRRISVDQCCGQRCCVFWLDFGGTESFGRNEIFQDSGDDILPSDVWDFINPFVRIPSLKWVFPKIGVYNPPKMNGLKKMVGKSLFFHAMILGKTP